MSDQKKYPLFWLWKIVRSIWAYLVAFFVLLPFFTIIAVVVAIFVDDRKLKEYEELRDCE